MSGEPKNWLEVTAYVYQVVWVDAFRATPAHYEVTYTYSVSDETYSNTIWDYRTIDADYLHRHDVIGIRYDPESPRQSYFALAHPGPAIDWKGLSLFVLGVATIFVITLLLE